MNILFIAYHSASYPIMESQGFAYMKKLSQKGVNYSLLTFEKDETVKDSKDYISNMDILINWRYLKYHSKPRLFATFFDIINGIYTVIMIIRKDNIKAIHARGFIAAIMAFLPSKLFNIKMLFDTRGSLADKYVSGGLLSKDSFIYKVMIGCEKFLIKRSDYFTVETDKHAEVMINDYNIADISSKLTVIPCCVDMSKFYCQSVSKPDSNKVNIVYLGKTGTWYLMDEMLDFFSIVVSKYNNSCFTFITSSDSSSIIKTAENKGISVNNILVKEAKHKDVPFLLKDFCAGIFFMNPYRQYNFSPIKFGEYLACGLPVVMNSGFGDCDEIVLKEDVGVIIDNFSLEEYTKALNKLKDLLSEGDDLRRRCRETAQKYFSLDIGVSRYLDIYKKMGFDC